MRKKIILKAMTALLFNSVMGITVALVLGINPVVGAVLANVAAACLGQFAPKGLRSGLEGSWLDGIPDQSSLVNNDVIHLVDVGIEPDVLVNNKTYPIPIQELPDGDIAIGLDKFQTKVTPITDDELYALSYDKMSRVKEAHANALNDSKFAKSAHALCANSNTATTPVLTTTGEREASTGRLRLCVDDLVNMKRALDRLKVPAGNRRLVLCPDHVNDLLLTNQSFERQYNIDRNTGKVGNLYGFDIYEYANNPVYTTAGVKKKLGEAGTKGEFACSFAFYTQRVFKATGSTKMYYSEASTDPQNQRSLINFRHYYLCMPKKADAGVVMTSGYKETA